MATLAHDTTWYIATNWESYYVSAVLSGIVGDEDHQDSGGYHISIESNSSTNYSVTRPDDKAPPGTWPRNLAAAIDMSMSASDMKLCSDRLWNVWYNRKNDPRAQYINAFNGWFNDGGPARRYDYYSGSSGNSSSDHKWHVHLEIRRKWVTDMVAAMAILSILRGQSLEDYLADPMSGGEEQLKAKYGDGVGDGVPPSSNTLNLQKKLQIYRQDSINHATHPLKIDGAYGDRTAYWVSVGVTGGDGHLMDGDDFAYLDDLIMDMKVAAAGGGGGGGTPSFPEEVTLVIPATTVTVQIPEITTTAEVQAV